jgi:hypothetical protein
VLWSNNDTVVANVVTSVANNEDLGSGNKAESLVAVCISEGDNWVPLEMRKELRICEY